MVGQASLLHFNVSGCEGLDEQLKGYLEAKVFLRNQSLRSWSKFKDRTDLSARVMYRHNVVVESPCFINAKEDIKCKPLKMRRVLCSSIPRCKAWMAPPSFSEVLFCV